MAISLQLAAALQKAAPPQSAVASAAAAATDDASAGTLPFAAIMGDLLRPQLEASTDAISPQTPADPSAETAADAVATPADAATQALLASLALPTQPAQQTPGSPPPTDAAPADEVIVAADAGPRRQVQDLLQPGTTAVEPEQVAVTADASAAETPSFASLLPAAPGEQKLPEAANIAATAPDLKAVRALADSVIDEPVAPAAPSDGIQVRHAAAPSASTAAASATPAASAQYVIHEPVSSSRWGDAISQRALFMVDQQVQSAELHLNPPHLGPLEVKLALDGDKATLSFNTQQAAVREAVQQSLPKLQQVFADNGLAELNVQVHLGQQQQPQQQERQNGGRQYTPGDSAGGDLAIEQTGGLSQSRWRSQSYASARGGVDIFA